MINHIALIFSAACLVLAVVGTIHPRLAFWYPTARRRYVVPGYLAGLVVFLILFGVTLPDPEQPEAAQSETPQSASDKWHDMGDGPEAGRRATLRTLQSTVLAFGRFIPPAVLFRPDMTQDDVIRALDWHSAQNDRMLTTPWPRTADTEAPPAGAPDAWYAPFSGAEAYARAILPGFQNSGYFVGLAKLPPKYAYRDTMTAAQVHDALTWTAKALREYDRKYWAVVVKNRPSRSPEDEKAEARLTLKLTQRFILEKGHFIPPQYLFHPTMTATDVAAADAWTLSYLKRPPGPDEPDSRRPPVDTPPSSFAAFRDRAGYDRAILKAFQDLPNFKRMTVPGEHLYNDSFTAEQVARTLDWTAAKLAAAAKSR